MPSPVYEIDGKDFSTLEGFFQQVWSLLAGYPNTGKCNLDAFHDILSWPESPYTFVWKNSGVSEQQLGYSEIIRKLEAMLESCHSSNQENISERIRSAREGKGPTMYDWLVEIILENKQYVTLRLE